MVLPIGVPLEKMAQWQTDLLRFMEASYPEIGKDIAEKKMITDDNRASTDESARCLPSTDLDRQ